MDPLHLHLLLNHFPVIGTIIGIAILLYGFLRKKDEVKQAGLGIFFVIALMTIPVYTTGEPAEERIENAPGISEAHIEEHEAAALPALIAMEVTGALALLGLFFFFRKPSLADWNAGLVLVLAVITFSLMARAANLGGQIRHAEIRAGAAAASNEKPAQPESGKEEDDDDDDKD